jgi:hypothetical protein
MIKVISEELNKKLQAKGFVPLCVERYTNGNGYVYQNNSEIIDFLKFNNFKGQFFFCQKLKFEKGGEKE